jgi:hypothetical protein
VDNNDSDAWSWEDYTWCIPLTVPVICAWGRKWTFLKVSKKYSNTGIHDIMLFIGKSCLQDFVLFIQLNVVKPLPYVRMIGSYVDPKPPLIFRR